MGAPDFRLDSHGKPNYLLQQQLKGYARHDPPASRVKPIPFPILQHMQTSALTTHDHAVADLAIVGFFFLLRPGEHVQSQSTSDTRPFTLRDVTFQLGTTLLPAASTDPAVFALATFVTLRFTRQKNGTENEIIGHARSGHTTICPVLALIRRCTNLRLHQAPPTTPLSTVYTTPTHAITVNAATLTAHLRRSAAVLQPTTGFDPADVSSRALRAGGAMALLCAEVDSDTIQLLGRWKSNQMLRYLHVQAHTKVHTFSKRMVQNGDFRLLHNQSHPITQHLQQEPDLPHL